MTDRRSSRRASKPATKFLSPGALLKAARAVAKLDPSAVLAGGFAMQMFGSRRLTGDLDVLVESVPEGVEELRRLSFGGVKSRVAGVPTDFIVRDDVAQDLYDAARLSAVAVSGYPLKVVSPEYMVSLKLFAGRAKDHGDIETIFGWNVDRKKILSIAKKFLGIMAVKNLEQMMALSDWKRSRSEDEDE